MPVFPPLPLGQRIPDSLHGVSCSLPTLRAVVGYEEKDPEILRQMTSGYPRFVQHPFLRQAAARILRDQGRAGQSLWLTSSVRSAEMLRAWLQVPAAEVVLHERLSGVAFPENPETFARAKTFLQHTGALLSSREAEDFLLRMGEVAAPQDEANFSGYAAGRVKGALQRAFPAASAEDLFLANSGMNAVYATFRAASALQAARGRTVWIQLGWLYLDTIAILQKFTGAPANYVFHSDVLDLAGLRRLFAQRGSEIAGIITEVPTNPLIQTPDLEAVYALCQAHEAILVVDPTVASPLNLDVLPRADLVVNSLTKYAASEGDVILGAVVINACSPFASELRRRLPGELEPVYSRDLARLAAQIGDYETVVVQSSHNAAQVVDFLQRHPRIKSLFWTHHPASRAHYMALARNPALVGSMLSFGVDRPLAQVYDRLRLAKGPSFGMKRSLICPFIYLAHYDLVTSEQGRVQLAASGLDPCLLRLSVGCEPVEAIIAALAEALD